MNYAINISVEEVYQKTLSIKKRTTKNQHQRPRNWDPVGDSAMDD